MLWICLAELYTSGDDRQALRPDSRSRVDGLHQLPLLGLLGAHASPSCPQALRCLWASGQAAPELAVLLSTG